MVEAEEPRETPASRVVETLCQLSVELLHHSIETFKTPNKTDPASAPNTERGASGEKGWVSAGC